MASKGRCGVEVGRRYFIVTWSGEENIKLCSLIQVPFRLDDGQEREI